MINDRATNRISILNCHFSREVTSCIISLVCFLPCFMCILLRGPLKITSIVARRSNLSDTTTRCVDDEFRGITAHIFLVLTSCYICFLFVCMSLKCYVLFYFVGLKRMFLLEM